MQGAASQKKGPELYPDKTYLLYKLCKFRLGDKCFHRFIEPGILPVRACKKPSQKWNYGSAIGSQDPSEDLGVGVGGLHTEEGSSGF